MERELQKQLREYIRLLALFLRRSLGPELFAFLLRRNASLCLVHPPRRRHKIHASWKERGRTKGKHIRSGPPENLIPIVLAWKRLKGAISLLKLLQAGRQEEGGGP